MVFSFCFGENAFLRSSCQEVFYKKGVLRNFAKFTGEHCARVSFLIKFQAACNFIKNNTQAQVYSCEFGQFLRTPFLTEHLRWLLLLLHFPSSLLYHLFMQENVQTNIKLSEAAVKNFLKISLKFRNIVSPLLQNVFNKVVDLKACIYIKKETLHSRFLKKI